jgi:hypothetical protein
MENKCHSHYDLWKYVNLIALTKSILSRFKKRKKQRTADIGSNYKFLEETKLSFKNFKGQDYDNGSNMRRNEGVPARMRQENPSFMPYGCRSLNLVVRDAAISCTEAVWLFCVKQDMHILFSTPVGRWEILKGNIPTFTAKPFCNTHLECRIDCSKLSEPSLSSRVQEGSG